MSDADPRRGEASAVIGASPEAVFAHLDDPVRLGEHMSRSSMMMGGGRMAYELDPTGGKAVGSHIKMRGRAFGLDLFVEEAVTARDPPRRKEWRTLGEPRLLVIGAYRMGFEITPQEGGSRLRVWIDHQPPKRGPGRLAPVLGGLYARWCVRRIAADTASSFGPKAAPS